MKKVVREGQKAKRMRMRVIRQSMSAKNMIFNREKAIREMSYQLS